MLGVSPAATALPMLTHRAYFVSQPFGSVSTDAANFA